MFAYYTAARWFGITLDLVLGMFCAIVGLFELYTVKDSSTAGMIPHHYKLEIPLNRHIRGGGCHLAGVLHRTKATRYISCCFCLTFKMASSTVKGPKGSIVICKVCGNSANEQKSNVYKFDRHEN